jgi:hypothetical protein
MRRSQFQMRRRHLRSVDRPLRVCDRRDVRRGGSAEITIHRVVPSIDSAEWAIEFSVFAIDYFALTIGLSVFALDRSA